MKKIWFDYSQKFITLSSREQILLLLSGLALIFFIMSFLFIDQQQAQANNFDKQIETMRKGNSTLDILIKDYQIAIARDTDLETNKTIEQLNVELNEIDNKLSRLNKDLISPNQMRTALIKLLALEPGVSLLSFELIAAQPLLKSDTDNLLKVSKKQVTSGNASLNVYKHVMKIKLSGEYFL